MKLISMASVALLVSCLLGCASPATTSKTTPEPASETSVKPAKTGQNNLKIPYPNSEVAVRTRDGKMTRFKSNDQGLVRLPDGDLFDPPKTEIFVCRSSTACPAPTH